MDADLRVAGGDLPLGGGRIIGHKARAGEQLRVKAAELATQVVAGPDFRTADCGGSIVAIAKTIEEYLRGDSEKPAAVDDSTLTGGLESFAVLVTEGLSADFPRFLAVERARHIEIGYDEPHDDSTGWQFLIAECGNHVGNAIQLTLNSREYRMAELIKAASLLWAAYDVMARQD